jgi:ApaG protein
MSVSPAASRSSSARNISTATPSRTRVTFVWAYTVTIENHGRQTVTLRTRYWKITDATGHVQEVRGAGVVGEQPTLKPGDSYSYTSGCPLKTSSGFMVGAYQMQLATGEFINVEIPAFSLDSPHDKHAIN